MNPSLGVLKQTLKENKYNITKEVLLIRNGRVRAGYVCGETLFGRPDKSRKKGVIHIIGERPGSGPHNFSVYITVAEEAVWNKKGRVDHDITKVVSGISDSSLKPKNSIKEIIRILKKMLLPIV